MSRIKHKIAAVLALFGGLVMASAALAQTDSGGGDAALQSGPPSSIAPGQSLQFGQVFRSSSGSVDFGLICGNAGTFSLIDPAGIAVFTGSARQCGQVTLTPGSDTDITFNLRFGGTPTDVRHSNGNMLVTTYTLTNASGTKLVTDFMAGDASESFPSGPIDGIPDVSQNFYIGGTVSVSDGAAIGEYTSTYEVVFTVVDP